MAVNILLGVTVAIVAATCLFIASNLRFKSRENRDLLHAARAQIDDQAKRLDDLEARYGAWGHDQQAFDEATGSLRQALTTVQADLHRIESLTLDNEKEMQKVKALLGHQPGPGH